MVLLITFSFIVRDLKVSGNKYSRTFLLKTERNIIIIDEKEAILECKAVISMNQKELM